MKKYLKFMIPAVILMICGILATVFNLFYHSPYYTFKRYFESENVADARKVFSENKDNERFTTRAEKLVSAYYEDQKEQYIDHKLGYTDAVSHINSYSMVYSGTDIISALANIEDSRESFDRGRQYQENNEYRAAIEEYEQVSEEDEENYPAIEDKISECRSSIVADTLTRCNEHLGKSEYKKAYEVLSKLEETYVTDEIRSKQTEVKNKYSQEIKTGAGEYIAKNDPLGALKYINNNKVKEIEDKEIDDLYTKTQDQYVQGIIAESDKLLDNKKLEECLSYLNDAMKTCDSYSISSKEIKKRRAEVIDLFGTDIITKADKQAAAGNYNTAIAIIEEAQRVYDYSRFDSKISEYRKTRDKDVISTYKSVVVYSYDYIEDKYTFKPKGVGDADYVHPTKRNLEPILVVDGNSVTFGLTCEYMYRSSSFEYFKMDKLLVQCDDKQYTFDIGYNDSKSDSEYSYPYSYDYEWTTLIHNNYFSYNGKDTLFDMNDFAKDIINANSITLRFYDGGKKRDFYVSSNEKTEFKNMWNLYTMLKDNPSAIEYIT